MAIMAVLPICAFVKTSIGSFRHKAPAVQSANKQVRGTLCMGSNSTTACMIDGDGCHANLFDPTTKKQRKMVSYRDIFTYQQIMVQCSEQESSQILDVYCLVSRKLTNTQHIRAKDPTRLPLSLLCKVIDILEFE